MRKIDELDLKLLDLLQNDARVSTLNLANIHEISIPTCLKRIKNLYDDGWIEQKIVILNDEKISSYTGRGLNVLIEVTLDQQCAESLFDFEQLVLADPAVQQCWCVSQGVDFILIVYLDGIHEYMNLSKRLFSKNTNVRHVKAFFATKRAKFTTKRPLIKL